MAIHVRGVVLPDDEVRDLWLVGDRITDDPVPGAETVSTTGFILPGLVDAHCHIGIRPGGGPIGDLAEAKELARIDRAGGVLAIRDAGSPYRYPQLDDDPDMPRLARAGRHVAPIRRYLRGIGVEVADDDLPAEVAEQAKHGNGWVKLVGDWIDRDKGDLAPLWSAEDLAEAVRVAHAAGSRVAVHTFGEDALPDLVAAGVDSVEHGTGLTGDTIAALAAGGGALVPTLVNVANFPGIAARASSRYPAYAEHMRRLHATAADRVRAAYEAGVPVYCGTDAGGMLPHGLVAAEIRALHAAGLPAAQALAAGSWAARQWLGLPGLAEGAPADLACYAADPRADLDVLAAPARIVLRGRVVR
jgi:imidazolonepropionase-like amidohydrolase